MYINTTYIHTYTYNVYSISFQTMFPDSQIAQNMSCGRTKCTYLATFGIGPYLSTLLIDCVKKQPFFVILFDESFNTDLQKQQMDILVRYWKNGQVCLSLYIYVLFSHFLF